MSSKLLEIPLRKTEPNAIGECLEKIIAKEFYQGTSSFEKDIETLDHLRQKIVLPELTPEGIELHKKYYIQLCSLETKFHDDSVAFPWYGTLGIRITGPATLKSFKYEKINVLYNIGCLFSHLAINDLHTDKDSLKLGYNYLQQSAGCFEMVRQQLLDLNEIPLEIRDDTIIALKTLMLAQAQELFWKTVVLNGMKDSMISKLAFQVSEFYAEACSYMKKTVSFKSEWFHHVECKKYQFLSSGHYRSSLTAASQGNYGIEIAHLQLSAEAVKLALSKKKNIKPEIVADLLKLEDTVNESLRRAERENDLIYLQVVPEKSSITVEKLTSAQAKYTDLEDPLTLIKTSSIYGPPLFARLVPYTIIQVAEAFKERIVTFVDKNIKDALNMLTKMLNNYINSKGLPASVDSMRDSYTIPDSIMEHYNYIKSIGGLQSLTEALESNKALAKNTIDKLEYCKGLLDTEESKDNALRQRYGTDRWTREPSSLAAASLRDKYEMLKGYIAHAEDGDSKVALKIQNIKGIIQVFENGPDALRKYIPYGSNSSGTGLSTDVDRKIRAVDLLLKEVQSIEKRRSDIIKDADIKSTSISFLSSIISQYEALQKEAKGSAIDPSNFESIFNEKKRLFDTEIMKIQKEKEIQSKLEEHINRANDDFLTSREQHQSEVELKRERALNTLEIGFSDFCEVLENLKEGNNFYNNFTTNIASFSNECRKFIETRKFDADELEEYWRIRR